MTTKDQEREALAKIRTIIEEIGGKDSYIGMAFKGCCDIAEDNIENDFGDSWMDRWSAAVDDHNKTREALREAIEENNNLKSEFECVKALHELAGIMKEVDGHNHDLVYEV